MKCWLMSAVALGTMLEAAAVVVQTDADGTTFDVTDAVLTITVPSGVTNKGYDYVANILKAQTITQVVKDGAGTLSAKSAPDYQGLWRIKTGIVDVSVNNAFGAVLSAPDEAKKLTIESGASVSLSKSQNSLNNKYIEIAGGVGSGATGAFLGLVASTVIGAKIKLTDDAQHYDRVSNVKIQGGMIDVAGHTYYSGGNTYANGYLEGGLIITNSNPTTSGRVVTPWTTEFKTHFGGVSFLAGSENILEITQAGRTYIEGTISGDWTFYLRSNMRGSRAFSTDTDKTGAVGWYGPGPVVITNTLSVGNVDAGSVKSDSDGHGFVINAPIIGAANARIEVKMGSWLSFGGTSSAYAGDLQLYGQNYSANRRCTVFFQPGMPFLTLPSKTVNIADSDIWMDSGTVRQISSFNITAGASTLTGSAAGSSIPSISMTGTINTLDTPATIGTYTLNAGTLAIGTAVPDITNLACAEGTTVDLNGHDMTVQSLVGMPTITGGGTLTVASGTLDVPTSAGVAIAQELRFPGTLTVTWCGGAIPLGERELLYFAPDAPLPTCAGTPVTGGELAFSSRRVTSGPYAGYTAVVAMVTLQGTAATHASTAADGTSFTAADQVLTINVPEGVTNTTDYAAIVADCFVTNIVKTGAGALDSVTMTTYDGDITLLDGEFIIGEDGDLGRQNSGTVRVKDGGAIRIKDNLSNGAISYKTLEFEGYGPKGLGAVRGPTKAKSNNYSPLRFMTYRLTGDAGWLNDKTRLDFHSSTLDFAGHELKIISSGSWSQTGYFFDCQTTNSVPETNASLLVGMVAGGSNTKLQLDGTSSWWGGTNNLIRTNMRTYLGKLTGDWTLALDGGAVWGANAGSSVTATNANYFTGPVWVKNANAYFTLNDSASPCPITLYGPIWGAADRKLNFNCIMHLYSDMRGFAGSIAIDGTRNTKYLGRNGVWIHDGCVFHCGAGNRVGIKNSDLTLDEGTAFRLPAFKHTGGEVQIAGGPRGDATVGRASFEGFENTADTLIFDSPAIVSGEMKVTAGTLSLATNDAARTEAELPVFSNLVFAADTTFDMQNRALTVPNLRGTPTVANAAALTISESYQLTNAVFATSGAVAFAPGAKIVVPKVTHKSGSYTVLTAAGGVTGTPEPMAEDGHSRYWKVRVQATSVVLEYVGGLLVIFR